MEIVLPRRNPNMDAAERRVKLSLNLLMGCKETHRTLASWSGFPVYSWQADKSPTLFDFKLPFYKRNHQKNLDSYYLNFRMCAIAKRRFSCTPSVTNHISPSFFYDKFFRRLPCFFRTMRTIAIRFLSWFSAGAEKFFTWGLICKNRTIFVSH